MDVNPRQTQTKSFQKISLTSYRDGCEPFFGKKININWGSLVKEKNLINGIKKYVLPDMGIQSEDVSFEVIEY